MTLTSAQKAAIEEVINIICTITPPRSKRQLAGMFLDLVDRTDWPQYYELIPEPRCLNNIRSSVEKNRYKDASDAYTDLSLVFWNALFYNESDSQIAQDAETLKGVLETEWKKRSVLPPSRASPPPSAPQKVHATVLAATPEQAVETPPPPPPPPPPPHTATPVVHPPPTTHVASTSTHVYSQKPVPIRPRSTPRQASSDVDVDMNGMSPEPDVQGEDIVSMERDVGSEEIVRQLEKGLPRWEGFGESGWMAEVHPDRHVEIVHAIKSHKDVIGNRVAVALEAVPEESTIPNLSYSFPLSLKVIESRVRSKSYSNSKEFDLEMARLFEKARRWHEPGTDSYGRILLLQRLYQVLTSPTPPPGPPYMSTTNFASLRGGPGNTRPLHSAETEGIPGVTTFRISTKDRTFVDEVHYRGWTVKLADWLHLSNADDPSRPIVAQVFRCWTLDDLTKKGQQGLTVCWYYRPEQTFHPAHRQFWEAEVFKTGHFADHSLDDIIEKIACQFTARHIRGRPRPPFWYLGWPLYVCDSRYNDRERVFVKIKNWNSCVPEEVRKSTEFMPIYPFEQTVFPRRFGSPFLVTKGVGGKGGGSGPVKGPGGIEESSVEVAEAGDKPDKGEGGGGGSGPGRKRQKRVGAGANVAALGGDHAGPNKGVYVGVAPGVYGGSTGAAGATQTATAGGHYHQYQPPVQPIPHHRSQASSSRDRSMIGAAGGLVNVGNNVLIEKLPPETAKHFDRDPETNEVLWFSAPPMNVARPSMPKHSLTYLHFLAKKRERENDVGSGDAMDVDGEASGGHKRIRVPPTMTETVNSILAELLAER